MGLLISFTKIVEMISSPPYTTGETLVLREMIEEFFVDYLRIIPGATFKPKDHFLTHYPCQILEVGRPLNHSTMRFEAKHNFFKDIYHRSNNIVNITKSLAMRHQYWMYLTYKKPNILQHETPKLISDNKIPVSMLKKTIQEKLKPKTCSEIKVMRQAKGGDI